MRPLRPLRPCKVAQRIFFSVNTAKNAGYQSFSRRFPTGQAERLAVRPAL